MATFPVRLEHLAIAGGNDPERAWLAAFARKRPAGHFPQKWHGKTSAPHLTPPMQMSTFFQALYCNPHM